MKKTIIATLTALTLTAGAISGVAYAHKGGYGSERAVERLTERLSLSVEQQTQLQEIFDQKMQDRRAMMENTNEEQREELHKFAREGVKAQTEAQIRSLLTPEQVALFDQMRSEKQGKGEGYHQGKGGYSEGKRGDDDHGFGKGKRGGKGGERCDH